MYQEKELIARALQHWANHIETGTLHLSKDDCIRSGDCSRVNYLTKDQLALVERLRQLAMENLTR